MTTSERSDRIRHAAGSVVDPELRRTLGELEMVGDVSLDDETGISLEIRLTVAECPAAHTIERDVRAAVESVEPGEVVTIQLRTMDDEQRRRLREKLRPGSDRGNPFGPGTLTRVIAVGSGKGGVGKSSVTVNVAAELAQRGFAVGVIDADVYGFSIPSLLGLTTDGRPVRPVRIDDMIVPPVAHGVKSLSIGMFVEDTQVAVAWRGPMLQRTISQFLTDAWFGALDFLLLDLPPGTGDVAITVGQLLPNSELLIVTTPQMSAADVAVRSGTLARQLGQVVIGVIENMSDTILPDGSRLDVFGRGGGEALAQRLDTPLIGHIPLSPLLRQAGDVGTPLVVSHPDDPAARAIRACVDLIVKRPMASRAALTVSPETSPT